MCWSGAYVATRAAGQTPMRGLAQSSTEMVQACFTPRMWIWPFLFGFALLNVALLCGVCLRLHPVCFRLVGLFFRVCVESVHASAMATRTSKTLSKPRGIGIGCAEACK
jgi:hypothetical protein